MILKTLISMIRPGNSIMAAIGVAIGFLFSGNSDTISLLLLIIAAMSSLGFGNVINDIYDIETDKIAHPERALPSGRISKNAALLFAATLFVLSLLCGFAVSPAHGIATLIPGISLYLYAIRLKSTPLAGNILISALVAYTLIFGALSGTPAIIAIPAFLAFITNFIREIVKDLDDEDGDRAAGLSTTAMLSRSLVNRLVYTTIGISIPAAYLPLLTKSFGIIYLSGILLILLPLQIRGIISYRKKEFARYSSNLKKQLLTGLLFIGIEGIAAILG